MSESPRPTTDIRPIQAQLFALFEPVAVSLGYELVAVELTNTFGRRTLRVSVDRPGGVIMNELARAQPRALGPARRRGSHLRGVRP
jgi:ribosome maturation factor RimP